MTLKALFMCLIFCLFSALAFPALSSCPHKHAPISWPAEPRKEVWTGEVRRWRRVTQRDGYSVHHQGELGGF